MQKLHEAIGREADGPFHGASTRIWRDVPATLIPTIKVHSKRDRGVAVIRDVKGRYHVIEGGQEALRIALNPQSFNCLGIDGPWTVINAPELVGA